MPFTLAHPAAVLPLRRYCPRHLDFAALAIGSVVPDIGYCFSRFNLDLFSHSILGSFLFDLPVGAFMLVALYITRRPFVNLLPVRYRSVFLPLCEKPPGAPWALVISLLLGIWTHLAWDSITHSHGWFVQHFAVMQKPLLTYGQRSLRLSHISWYVCSFGGVACLGIAYQRWRQAAQPDAPPFSMWGALLKSACLGALILPVELVHHLTAGVLSCILVGICSIALFAGLMLFIERGASARRRTS